MESHEQEVMPEETTQDTGSDTAVSQEEAIAASKQADLEKNIIEMRKAREREQKELLELKRKVKEYEESQKKEARHRADDDLAEVKDVREVERRVNETVMELKLRQECPNLEKVLANDNIEKLKTADPELMDMISQIQDPYRRISTAYKYIKKLGFHSEEDFSKEKAAIEANQSKPRSSSSSSRSTPLSQVDGFARDSKEYRDKIWKEMNYYASMK